MKHVYKSKFPFPSKNKMQDTSLMLYLKVTDFSLMSPSSHEVSIELSMKACRLEAENPSKF